jgi:hypothetical protein
MKIFFSILLSCCFLNSFSQEDSVKSRFAIGVLPLNFISPNENGLFAQYNYGKHISFELGGGIYNLIKHPLAEDKASGFTAHAAVILSHDKKISIAGRRGNIYTRTVKGKYFKMLFFWRQMNYVDRGYYPETGSIFQYLGVNQYLNRRSSDRDNAVVKVADEFKTVTCLEVLWGRKFYLGEKEHFFFNYYYGFGFRMKFSTLSVTKAYVTSPYLQQLSPPRRELSAASFLSVHGGVQIGYTF